MPYLPTSQAYLEQSSLLLQAYPETTRITTKYSFPSSSRQKKSSSTAQSNPTTSTPAATPSTAAPIATLTLKTFNPTSGICLKYRTNKGAEVGRLITSLGKLAGGADVASLGLSGPAPAAVTGDVEMVDAPPDETTTTGAVNNTTASNPAGQSSAKGGKSKKKGGKGKR
ncbi:hypothetical protein FE257_001423 [Aspergillus nanangensis]|uniref:SRP9 domain-containing protein n=1 Tax=Aspergillus nanangensis TaxID=2582783 RepID=A0AAD4CDS9_ASPNN|nr:hypothetical protein FE257_001423 [Aspergillus nanangensis]